MSKVDWSLAPEGATHYGYVSEKRICWYIVRDKDRYDYAYQNEGRNAEKWSPSCGNPGHPPLIERPSEQSKPWSGPEDGLPPVGLEVLTCVGEVTVLAHGVCRDLNVAICQGKNTIHTVDKYAFHPLRTPEQLAAEKRETAIRELMDIAQVDCRVTAARLVDAGFKR